jgi:hypothetical protein
MHDANLKESAGVVELGLEAVKTVISRYYAGRTAEGLARVQQVLVKFIASNEA